VHQLQTNATMLGSNEVSDMNRFLATRRPPADVPFYNALTAA
jgi:hypothetical protein